MDATRLTLLERAGQGAPDAWAELDQLYRPFIFGWFSRQGVGQDADDLTQDVMAALLRDVPGFEHSRRIGAFRTWLRTVCRHRLLNFRRTRARRGTGVGGTEFNELLHEVEDPDHEQDAEWDREHDRTILLALFERLATEFDPKTMEAFRLLALDGRSAGEVAQRLGISPGAVYVAKSRVLRRLRESADGLIDPGQLPADG